MSTLIRAASIFRPLSAQTKCKLYPVHIPMLNSGYFVNLYTIVHYGIQNRNPDFNKTVGKLRYHTNILEIWIVFTFCPWFIISLVPWVIFKTINQEKLEYDWLNC